MSSIIKKALLYLIVFKNRRRKQKIRESEMPFLLTLSLALGNNSTGLMGVSFCL